MQNEEEGHSGGLGEKLSQEEVFNKKVLQSRKKNISTTHWDKDRVQNITEKSEEEQSESDNQNQSIKKGETMPAQMTGPKPLAVNVVSSYDSKIA